MHSSAGMTYLINCFSFFLLFFSSIINSIHFKKLFKLKNFNIIPIFWGAVLDIILTSFNV